MPPWKERGWHERYDVLIGEPEMPHRPRVNAGHGAGPSPSHPTYESRRALGYLPAFFLTFDL